MDEPKPPSLAKRLIGIGVKKSYAYMIQQGERSPSLVLALRIHRELGVKLGPIANASDEDIEALVRISSQEVAA